MTREQGIGRIVRDVVSLCELQWELLSLDGKVASDKVVKAGILVSIGIAILGSSLTVMLVGIGWVLYDVFEWPIGYSLLGVSILSVAVAAVLLAVAYASVNAAMSALSETKSEFSENLKWMKAVILKPDTSPRNVLRRESFASDTGGNSQPETVSSHRY